MWLLLTSLANRAEGIRIIASPPFIPTSTPPRRPGGSFPSAWRVGRDRVIPLDRPRIMAILNVTPDSFSDGGRLPDADAALDAARRAVAEGADILDIGGESTRPGAAPVSSSEQTARVVPAIRAIRGAGIQTPITVDTTRAEVARAALDAGADGVNDVSGATDDPGMLALVASRGAGIVLMHRIAPPSRDRYSDRYDAPPIIGDVVAIVREWLRDRIETALSAGVVREAICIDPGLGFGKTVEQNLELIRRTAELAAMGLPILSGLSRKSFVGRACLGRDSTPDERLIGTIGLSVAHRLHGADVFRVHDVEPHAQALRAAEFARDPVR
jgi:dihydropteroate synthase